MINWIQVNDMFTLRAGIITVIDILHYYNMWGYSLQQYFKTYNYEYMILPFLSKYHKCNSI